MTNGISLELKSYQEKRLAQFLLENQLVPQDVIVFVGDSITEFFPLKDCFGNDKSIINRGIAGTDTEWLKKHLVDQVISVMPKKIFLLIGTNDIGRGRVISKIIENISDILRHLHSEEPNTDIYILSVLPVNHSQKFAEKVKIRTNTLVSILNNQLRQLENVQFIDLYPILLDQDGELAESYTTDGLHLTEEAYYKLSEVIKSYL